MLMMHDLRELRKRYFLQVVSTACNVRTKKTLGRGGVNVDDEVVHVVH